MKLASRLFKLALVAQILLVSCEIGHRTLLNFDDPRWGRRFDVGQTFHVKVNSAGPVNRWEVYDNGRLINQGDVSPGIQNIEFDHQIDRVGEHFLDARVMTTENPDPQFNNRWSTWASVCIYIGEDPPEGTCAREGTTTRAYPIEEATATSEPLPSETPYSTQTSTPTLTPTLIPYEPSPTKGEKPPKSCSGLSQLACTLNPNCTWNFAANFCQNK